MHPMERCSRALSLAIGMLAVGGFPVMVMAQTAGTSQGAAAVKLAATSDGSKVVDCNPALERFLPGAFDFCKSVVYWQAGKYARGLEWAQLSAGWAEKKAQFALGIAYFNGELVAANRPLGLAWLTLAAERKDPYYTAVMVSARSKLSPDEQATADKLLVKMQPKYGDAYAAVRAETHFNREMKSVRDDAWSPYVTGIYIDGLGTTQPLMVAKQLEDVGATYFQGWKTHVTVGDLQTQSVPAAPAAPASTP